jgi:hypothetical protein
MPYQSTPRGQTSSNFHDSQQPIEKAYILTQLLPSRFNGVPVAGCKKSAPKGRKQRITRKRLRKGFEKRICALRKAMFSVRPKFFEFLRPGH